MWSSLRFLRSANSRSKLLPSVAVMYALSESSSSHISFPPGPQPSYKREGLLLLEPDRILCEQKQEISKVSSEQSQYLRKRATLRQAAGVDPQPTRRFNTKQELNKIRQNQNEMLRRWERDEDGWRDLPARAWPAFQPNVEQMEEIRKTAISKGCFSKGSSTIPSSTARPTQCDELLFQIATTLVFYNVNPKSGLEQFKQLADSGHVDAMVACGVVLVEGLGVSPNEDEGIAWLRRAANLGSSQAYYELGTVYYTGIAGVVEEDSYMAFELFERAAKSKHVAAMYMMADCLAEGEGVTKDVARAVPLFYEAAEQGHRYARQRIRELLASGDYQDLKE